MHDEPFPPTAGDPGTAHSRRALLAGVGLAASGLVLPADLLAARERGRKPGQMRDRRRDRREEREERREERRGDPPPRGFFTRDVAFGVDNRTAAELRLRSWRFDAFERWVPQGRHLVPPGEFRSVTGNEGLVVQVGDDRWVLGFNPAVGFPFAAIGDGGWTKAGEEAGTRLAQRDLAVGDRVDVASLGLEVLREADSRAFIVFRLVVR